MRKMGEGHECSGMVGQLLTEITVEPVLFLYMLSTFSQYALFQDLVYSKVCLASYNGSVCDNLHQENFVQQLNVVQANASYWILMSTITLVIPSLLIAIYLGSWSDRFGRKWPVVIPPLGGAFSCLVYILISFKADAPVAWILLASSLSGLSGGFVSCIMSCMTYVAAVSTEENRTVRISRLEAMTFLGGTIGPFVSGSMLQVTGHGFAFFFMMVSYLLAVLYAIFLVRDVFDGTEQEENEKEKKRKRQLVLNSDDDEVEDEQRHQPPPLMKIANKSVISPLVAQIDSKSENHKPLLYAEQDVRRGNATTNNNQSEQELPVVRSNSIMVVNERIMRGVRSRPSVWSGNSSESSQTNSTTGIYNEARQERRDREDDEHGNMIISRRRQQDSRSWCSHYFGSQHLVDVLATAFRKREDNRRLFLILVVIAAFISMMATAGELDVAYLFAKDLPLSWSYQTYSYYFGFKYGLGAFMLLVGMPVFLRLELPDTTICIIGLFSRMAGLVLYGLSTTTTMAFCVPIVAIFSFFTIPATRALLSKIVAPSEHGKMFSFVAIMEDLCTLSASLLFNSVYPVARQLYRGSIFFMAAILLLIPFILIWFVRRNLVLTSLSMISSPSPTSMESGGTISESLESSSKEQNEDDDEDELPPDSPIMISGSNKSDHHRAPVTTVALET